MPSLSPTSFQSFIMILDQLSQADQYSAVHPGFAAAFEYLRTADYKDLPEGRHEIDGDRMYLIINRTQGKGREGATFEVHRRHIDIQLAIVGTDEMAWRALRDCSQPQAPFHEEHDYGLFNDPAETWLVVPPGSVAIFFPQDVHAPLGGTGDLVKAVIKVAVDWK